jgi:YihY family inner membrane protein
VGRSRQALETLDRFQQRHAWSAFPVAVVRKFGDDQAGSLAALVAYYGFFSLFPLLLVLVTVLSFVLEGDVELQRRILDSALGEFPVIGDQLGDNVGQVRGSGLALLVGLLGALWGGLGVMSAAQNAMNEVWNVPRVRRPNVLLGTARSLALLVVLGGGVLLTTALAGLGAAVDGGGPLGLAVSLLVNGLLFLLAFRVLTSAPVGWRDLWPGALLAGAAWSALQALGSWYVQRQLRGASDVYGTFATVIGLLSWLYLAAQVTLLAAEVNVVRTRRLWPRSLVQAPLTDADREALVRLATEEERRPEQRIDVSFEADGGA